MNWYLKVITTSSPLILRLLLAIAVVGAAVGIRIVMRIDPGTVCSFVTFYPAVAFASLIPGFTPGLLALLLSIVVSWYVVLPPPYSFEIFSWNDGCGLLVFATMGTAFLLGGSAMQNSLLWLARERAERIAQAEPRQILLRALRYCISHYLHRLAMALMVQRDRVTEPEAQDIIDDSIERLSALERLYRRLYAPEEFATGSAGLFVEDICRDLMFAASLPRVHCEVSSCAVSLPTDQRVSLGLIVAELITDALERAPEGSSTIEVSLEPLGDDRRQYIRLTVRDGGHLSTPADRAKADWAPSLTRALAQQLDGRVDVRTAEQGGVTVTVTLPTDRSLSELAGAAETYPALSKAKDF